MQQLTKCVVGVLMVLLASTCVQAKLQLVENFDGMAVGAPDGAPCTGVLGGTWDTQGEGTGNVNVEDNSGSRVLQFRSHSSGVLRAVGFNGITNEIAEGETGVVFLRFTFRTNATELPRTYMGFISDASDNPITTATAGDPMDIIAGFGLLDDGAGGFDVTATDGTSVLKAGLARGQWYNVWMVADNAADTFDLYLSEAGGPAGEATLPAPEDLVAKGVPFGVATTDPLNGMVFACPDGTGQSTRTYVDEIWWDGDQGLAAPTKAAKPSPANGATDVSRDSVLSWTPAPSAVAHDVYLGTSLDEVSSATASSPLLVSRSQTASTYGPGRLELAQTYYWRVDEVNGPPDNTVFKGSVWSFTTELLAYPIENVTATASSSEPGKGPENVVNGSGLDGAGLLHGNIGVDTMWLSSGDGGQPTWIQFEFDRIYKLYEMWVWNSNESLEQAIGFGIRDVVIEYSSDGLEFTTLGTANEFSQGPGTAGYAHNTTIDFSGAAARFVRLTVNSNWGGILNQYGLSEVRFFYIPVNARDPQPASGATNLGLDMTLGWTAGRQAGKHDVYFSSDMQAVIDGTAPLATVTQAGYGPLALDLGTTYYWRVDEVNDVETPAVWPGEVWNFRTQEFFVVDDFEAYDAADNQIWYTWIDGLGYGSPSTPPYDPGNGTGSAVGNENTASFTEETIVHSGKQSMPIFYDNNKPGALKYSEAMMTLTGRRDWTARGVQSLSLWFRGNPGSVGSFVEGPVGTYTLTAGGADIWNQADEFHFAYKQLSGVGSIVAKVESVQNTNAWAKAGVMIRETLEPGSKFAAVYMTPTNADGTPTQGCRFQGRTDANGNATSDTSVATAEQMAITAPYWIKLERDAGGSFRGYYATDGVNWKTMAWRPTISMSTNAYIGLALTSHDVALACQAVFTNVTITGTANLQWAHQDIGIASNDAEPLYVALSNTAGQPAVMVHPDPAAATTTTWTEWVIPLQGFADQGINLSNVDKLAIGLGTRGNTTIAGGSGTMYFDDIRLSR